MEALHFGIGDYMGAVELTMALHLTLNLPVSYMIYVVAGVVQLLFSLWFLLLSRQKR